MARRGGLAIQCKPRSRLLGGQTIQGPLWPLPSLVRPANSLSAFFATMRC
jgi:hypothetical protein